MDLKTLNLKNALRLGERGAFPRPDRLRAPSYLLGGEWDLLPDREGRGMREGWYTMELATSITRNSLKPSGARMLPLGVKIPFPLEAAVNQEILARHGLTPGAIADTKRFWYFAHFNRPEKLASGMLHFGAVDYRATVWLNGRFLGTHEGGYTPFCFPVKKFEGENVLAVMVEDSRSASQVRGKQTFLKKPFMVWYDGCTGIWQPVWIEPLGRIYIHELSLGRDKNNNLVIRLALRGFETTMRDVRVSCKIYASQIYGKERSIIKTPLKEYVGFSLLDAMNCGQLEFVIPEKVFTKWSVEFPSLHPVQIVVRHGDRELDTLHLMIGVRQIEAENGMIRLNKKELYQRLLLNQGYYPGGHYTPMKSEQFKTDIELMKRAGFNGCRMHQKIEHPAFLYWADLLGFLVWEEMPSYYIPLQRNMKRLEAQFRELMQRDCLHPSVITLVLFNESWGIYDIFLSRFSRRSVIELFKRCKQDYPGYLIIDNSGFHHLITDVTDIHHYLPRLDEVDEFYGRLSNGVREAPLWLNFLRMLGGKENVQTPFIRGYGETKSPLLISEFGGYGFSIYKHEDMSLDQFLEKHISLLIKHPRIQGFCYTQFTDTYQEKNGLFTMDRVPKSRKIRDYIERLMIRNKYDKGLSR